MKKLTIPASDGYNLGALIGQSGETTLGYVVISPATAVKKEFYIPYAEFLICHGYIVVLFDYRGVGESLSCELSNSDAYIHEWGTLDMNAVVNFLVHKKGFKEIIWIGHSIGAQLTGFIKNTKHVKKVIAINAAVGYWGYFPFPKKWLIWSLWYLISPALVWLYGYGTMKIVGWGENLPKHVFMEWRDWCLRKTYYMDFIRKELKTDKFYQFLVPITFVYTSDDYIANDKTAPLMLEFFPNAPAQILKLDVEQYTLHKPGHIGIFRKKFEHDLWIALKQIIEA